MQIICKQIFLVAAVSMLLSQYSVAGELVYAVKEYAKHGYVTLDLERNMNETIRDYNKAYVSNDKKKSSYELLGLCFLAMAKEQNESYLEVSRLIFNMKYPSCSVFDSFK